MTPNTRVVLDGSRSYDPDGAIKRFQWRQTKGLKVKLSQPRAATAFFVSPVKRGKSGAALRLRFRLTVEDDRKLRASQTVWVTVDDLPHCGAAEVLRESVCVPTQPVCSPGEVLHNGLCSSAPATTVSCVAPQVLADGVCKVPAPVCAPPAEWRDGACRLPEPGCPLPLVGRDGICTEPAPTPAFNDTGVTRCSDGLFTVPGCGLQSYPGQDGESGRDVTHANDLDGHGGFSFSKIGPDGGDLPLDAAQWTCLRDNVTGLVWEMKQDDGGLHDRDSVFTHLGTVADPALGPGAVTDTAGYVAAVNAERLCGAGDWRLPAVHELQSVLDYSAGLPGPTLDVRFFPNTVGGAYWSADAHSRKPGHGWAVYFDDGRIFDHPRGEPLPVRLVRSGGG